MTHMTQWRMEQVNGEREEARKGLGKVVYSVEPDEAREERGDNAATSVVQEASEDSFPASDPPGYATGAAEEATIPPGSQAETEHPPHTEAVQAMTEKDREARRR